MTDVEPRQILNKIGMKKGMDPAMLFEPTSVENRYNTATNKIPQGDLITVISDSMPMYYKAVLTVEHRARGTLLTLDDLETVMNQHWWRQISKTSDYRNGF